MNAYKAVIFDIGGVVMRSPFIAIAAYERQLGLPANYLNTSMSLFASFYALAPPHLVERGSNGAWQRFERGELALLPFYDEFSRDLSDTVNGNRWYQAYCKRKEIRSLSSVPPTARNCVRRRARALWFDDARSGFLRPPHSPRHPQNTRQVKYASPASAAGKGIKIIALTNNFAQTSSSNSIPQSELEFLGWDKQGGAAPASLRGLFDDFCDSSELGARKPEPRFYKMALERNGLEAHQVVFLDDIGINLKAAKQLGMETIHVPLGGNLSAARQLEAKLGIDLTSNPTEEESTMAKL
ncbi:Epoxide hydrolase [Mycena chlorophos]|uniref:Epoxide hydrolase n=1 Tax=Mycena chlorophos TaxID=658473 RepID=A0A8H6WS58_MYCCL|nr:Epoxide hydrolase [Mycena chlorophos]